MSKADDLEFDPSIPEDERRFYVKAYPDVHHVRERKVHCTICKMHIGTAPANESLIRMHPILRVTHCKKCHDFYNSGEFSKGEDGSELYCRWCGQGGEVYCCSNCPFVFCKSCIISNLSRGVVADIEQNENWSCFNCAPKMLWPLRAQHWALIKFIDKQKKAILNSTLSDAEIKQQMLKDRSLCCKIKKNTGYGTDSSDSSDISLSRLKKKAGEKRSRKSMSKEDLTGGASPVQAKKIKSNDEVVCTPDVMSMLEPECTLTVPANIKVASSNPQPSTPSPKIMSIQPPAKRITPPPLHVRTAAIPALRSVTPPTQVLKKTVVGQRMPVSGQGSDFTTPVYHTINGYRIDLNSAAQQETVRLPNGKLIQVKRQGTGPQQLANAQSSPNQHSTPSRVLHNVTSPNMSPISNVPSQPQIVHSSGGHIIRAQLQSPRTVNIQNPGLVGHYQQQSTQQPNAQPQYQQITIRQPNQQIATIRYQSNPTPQMTNIIPNGGTMQIVNGTPQITPTGSSGQVPAGRQLPTFIKQLFPNTPLGQSRTQLQNQIFSAMEICQHLMGKLHTLTNSNAYKTARSMTDVKELYIHLSYLLTYAIGRFKGLQDNCLSDMRDLGFTNDANSLENGQLAAGTDMVRNGLITDFSNIDLESFHSLIVQNMNIVGGGVVDESLKTTKTNNEPPRNSESTPTSKKLTPLNYNRMIIGQNGHSATANAEKDTISNDNENDEESECLLVELDDSRSSEQIVELESESEQENQSEEDCLLVELGDRKSDRHTPSPSPSSVEEIGDQEAYGNFAHPGLVNEMDKDYNGYESDERRNNYHNLSSNFTQPQDIKLIQVLKNYPLLWYPKLTRTSIITQNELWKRIRKQMPQKQASDAEEDEITIVEPKTDTINLDSDNEDDQPPPNNKSNGNAPAARNNLNANQNKQPPPLVKSQVKMNTQPEEQQMPLVTPTTTTNADDEITAEYDFSKVASLLAGMLEVELTEGGNECVQQPKKPRKKTTHKPNPTLVKQKEMQERERLENIKKNCMKLKMEVEIPLNKVEEIYEYAKPLLEEVIQSKLRKKEEVDVSKKDIEIKEGEEQENGLEESTRGEAAIEYDINPETQSQKDNMSESVDKDDTEEIVVVLLEESDNPKEDKEIEASSTDNGKEGETETESEVQAKGDSVKDDTGTEDETKADAKAEVEVNAALEVEVDIDTEAKVVVVDEHKTEDKAKNELGADNETVAGDKTEEEGEAEVEDEAKAGDEAEAETEDGAEIEKDSLKPSIGDINEDKENKAKSKESLEDDKIEDVNDFPEPELFALDDIEAPENQEVSIDSDKNKSSELPSKSNENQPMDVDSDPPIASENDKDLLVETKKIPTPNKDVNQDVEEKNPETSSLSHNYNAILGQTEVA